MPKRGRPCLKCGERTVSVNVRFAESQFDRLCIYAKSLERQLDKSVSLASAVRNRMSMEVDESVYGPPDDRPSIDPRIFDIARESTEELIDSFKNVIRLRDEIIRNQKEMIKTLEYVLGL